MLQKTDTSGLANLHLELNFLDVLTCHFCFVLFCHPCSCRSACHYQTSKKHLRQRVPECTAAVPGGGRPPEHDVHLAERWRERLPRGVS